MLQVAPHDLKYTTQILLHIENGLMNLKNEDDVCVLVETISLIKVLVDDDSREPSRNEVSLNTTSTEGGNTDSGIETDKVKSECSIVCERMLTKLGRTCIDLAVGMSNQAILRVLTVLCRLPLHCDGLVTEIEQIIDGREEAVGQFPDFEAHIKQVSDSMRILRVSLMEHNSHTSTLQNGLLAIFGRNSGGDDEASGDDASSTLSDEPLTLETVEKMLAETTETLDALKEALKSGAMHSVHDMGKEGFELSRCKDALERYRRINFSESYEGNTRGHTHERTDRFMTKRVLSRLLP